MNMWVASAEHKDGGRAFAASFNQQDGKGLFGIQRRQVKQVAALATCMWILWLVGSLSDVQDDFSVQVALDSKHQLGQLEQLEEQVHHREQEWYRSTDHIAHRELTRKEKFIQESETDSLNSTTALFPSVSPSLEPWLAKFLLARKSKTPFSSRRHLVVTWYRGVYNDARLRELLKVLKLNLRNAHLSKVHVLCENPLPVSFLQSLAPASANKLIQVPMTPGQPTYANLFAYCNAAFSRGALVVISNSDVSFGESLACARPVSKTNRLVFNQTSRRIVLALSRHPAPCGVAQGEHNECLKYRGSHDTFVFAPPLADDLLARLDFRQNLLGAENRLLWELRSQGYRIANPCQNLRAQHHHCVRGSRIPQSGRFASRGDRYAAVSPIAKFQCNDVIY